MIYPGRIVEYFPDTQTANIIICAERVFSNIEGLAQTVERATLIGVPVHTSSGGGWSVTFPIAQGDTCLIMLSSVGYDHWMYQDRDGGGKVAGQPAPQLRRSFSEDDGFAIVGLNTLPRKIAGYSAVDSQWRNSDASQLVSLNADGTITITGASIEVNGDVTVNGAITATGDIVGAGISLSTHTHAGDSGGVTGSPQ